MDAPALKDLRYEVVKICNMGCPHCYMEASRQDWMLDILSIEEFMHILDEAIPLGLEKFSFTGGEPLAEPGRILQGTARLAENNISVRIFTNGTLLTPKLVRQFEEAGVNEIYVSIDGLGATHDEFRGFFKGFEIAIDALKMIKQHSQMAACARVTLTSENYREIQDLMESYLLPLNLKKMNFRPFAPCGRGKLNQKYMLTPNQHKEVISYLVGLQKKGERINLVSNCYAFLYGGEDKQCTCGVSQAYLTYNGHLKACGYMPVVIGDCRKQSIKTLWESENPILHALRSPVSPDKCTGCKYYNNPCQGGCKASAYSVYKSFCITDPVCPFEGSD